jgi:hypothetical protein
LTRGNIKTLLVSVEGFPEIEFHHGKMTGGAFAPPE